MVSRLKEFAYRIRDFLIGPLLGEERTTRYADAASQLQLMFFYRALAASGSALPAIDEVGFKVFSQTDEDGILLYIFAILGMTNKRSIEICAGNGIECNTANLIINHGWSGLLVDGDQTLVKQGKEFYSRNPSTRVYPPNFIDAWVTRDNVNELIEKNGFAGDIDLLSIDLDSVDYWIWEAIHVIDPRVVVVEYNGILGPEKALTVPYEREVLDRATLSANASRVFFGASLPAFVKIAKRKGYRLVGCNRNYFNAFFVKNGLREKEIPEITVAEHFQYPKILGDMQGYTSLVEQLPWVEV